LADRRYEAPFAVTDSCCKFFKALFVNPLAGAFQRLRDCSVFPAAIGA
jgi:hypothetical protein